MTIMATHFALVLGAWRLRVRIDIDEPRESDLRDVQGTAAPARAADAAEQLGSRVATWGRG